MVSRIFKFKRSTRWRQDLINWEEIWLDGATNFMLSSFFSLLHLSLVELPSVFMLFQPTLICRNLNAMSVAVYCPTDYIFLFPLIINVSVPNITHLVTSSFCLAWGDNDSTNIESRFADIAPTCSSQKKTKINKKLST